MKNYFILIVLIFTSEFCYCQCSEMDKWLTKAKSGDIKCQQDWSQIAQWYGMECQCNRGWILKDGHKISIPKKDAEMLEKIMDAQANRINYQPHYTDCVPVKLSRYKKCLYDRGELTIDEYKNKQSGNGIGRMEGNINTDGRNLGQAGQYANVFDFKEGLLLNSDRRDLLNSLAANSKDTLFQQMVQGINENHIWVNKFRDFGIQTGIASQSDLDFYNTAESVGQAIKVGEFIFNKIQQKKKEKEELRRQQALIKKESDKYIQTINEQLNVYYHDAAHIPTATHSSLDDIKKIRQSPKQFKLYNDFTAAKRLLVIKYLESPILMTVNDLIREMENIQQKELSYGTNSILTEIETITKNDPWFDKYYPFLLNENRAFRDSYNLMYFKISGVFSKLNMKDSSSFYLNKVGEDISSQGALELSITAFKEKNYSLVKKLAPILTMYLEQEGPRSIYPNLKFNYASGIYNDVIRFDRVIYLKYIGIMALIRIGDIEEAIVQTSQTKVFIDQFKQRIGQKAKRKSESYDEQILLNSQGEQMLQSSKLYMDIIEASLDSRKGDHDQAISKMEKIVDENGILMLGDSELTIADIHFENLIVLINAKKYEAALTACYELMRADIGQSINKNNFLKEVKFHQAFLEFKMDRLDKGLSTIAYIEALGNPNPKVYKLKSDIYAFMGDEEQKDAAQEMYKNTMYLK